MESSQVPLLLQTQGLAEDRRGRERRDKEELKEKEGGRRRREGGCSRDGSSRWVSSLLRFSFVQTEVLCFPR